MSYVTNRIDDKVVEMLSQGGVGLLPSDTIYGLSCVASNNKAVERIHKFKHRFENKPFIVLISNQAQGLQLGINRYQLERVHRFWPGGATFICEAKDTVNWLSLGTGTLAIRIPDDLKLIKLMKAIGPIISTSANLDAKRPAETVQQAKDYFGEGLDFYVDVGHLEGKASTLAKIDGDKLTIIRQGEVKLPALLPKNT